MAQFGTSNAYSMHTYMYNIPQALDATVKGDHKEAGGMTGVAVVCNVAAVICGGAIYIIVTIIVLRNSY